MGYVAPEPPWTREQVKRFHCPMCNTPSKDIKGKMSFWVSRTRYKCLCGYKGYRLDFCKPNEFGTLLIGKEVEL